MEMKTKVITGIVILLALAVLPLAAASSYELKCLGDGESLDFGVLCNPAMNPFHGPANICVINLDNGKTCPTTLNRCNNLGLSCGTNGGNNTVDGEPPVMTLHSPVDGDLYTSRSVLIDFDINERSDVFYQDKSDTRRWTQVCKGCTSYSRSRGFDEGLNDLTFKVVDRTGNEAYYDVAFSIDSKDPKIGKTLPDKGFASGDFSIEFQEDNPSELKIEYGNSETGFRTANVNIQDDCNEGVRGYTCDTHVDLADYDGESIQYYVSLEDVAGNIAQSRTEVLQVDNSDPVIESFDQSIDGRKVTFTLEINEPFFEEVTFVDNSDSRPREKRLCSRLDNGVCEKRVSFSHDGTHDVTFFVRDEAGNVVTKDTTFFTDSKKPRIRSTVPDRDFASGTFEVEFDEDNPESLVLSYGNTETGMRTRNFDLNACIMDRPGKYFCSEDVDLSDFDGEEIEYTFTLTDRVGQIDEDGEDGLLVDLSFPVINSIDWTVDRNRADLILNITEDNFDEADYINYNDRRPRESRICSRLRDGICERKIRLNDGPNEIQITVYDEAGNAVAETINIDN